MAARLALQGEENITSVSISRNGGLLVVATVSEVKIFQLIHSQPGTGSGIRIRKLDTFSLSGARIVKLAANGKWLAVITSQNGVQLLRIMASEDVAEAPRVLSKAQHLHRLDRDISSSNSLAGLSELYDRSIAHADFSTDGNAFAVADLSGYIDTWVIEGNEDSTALEVDVDGTAMAVDENDDSDADSDAAGENEGISFLGQRWIRNPSGHLLPRLDSAPVLLSFQPSLDTSSRPQPNGNPAVHPTRNNLHPHSHELPAANSRLLVVSAEHQLHLFDLLTGRLSDWSRRNPLSVYPREYQQLDSTAKGCIWDVSKAEQRLWLYGEKWLFMFDLAQDFSTSEQHTSSSKKRKRDSARSHSGAGAAIPQRDLPVTHVKTFHGDQNEQSSEVKHIDLSAPSSNAMADDSDVDEDALPLRGARQAITQNGQGANADVPNGVQEDLAEGGGEVMDTTRQRKRAEPWWHTFKYRPILGIVPISADDSHHAPEVVLVERPTWDFDLPPRFVGAHEQ